VTTEKPRGLATLNAPHPFKTNTQAVAASMPTAQRLMPQFAAQARPTASPVVRAPAPLAGLASLAPRMAPHVAPPMFRPQVGVR
jgi:hypothetical protein